MRVRARNAHFVVRAGWPAVKAIIKSLGLFGGSPSFSILGFREDSLLPSIFLVNVHKFRLCHLVALPVLLPTF